MTLGAGAAEENRGENDDHEYDDDENEPWQVVSESHWAVGWVEWIAIHEDATEHLDKANELAGELADYPILNESHLSELEIEEANETWQNCYDNQERVEYIREHRSQFEFHDFEDMLSCVRGNYFSGYASEMLN